jgi:hypothetical protein
MEKTPKDLEGLKRIMSFATKKPMIRCFKQLDIIDYNYRILH